MAHSLSDPKKSNPMARDQFTFEGLDVYRVARDALGAVLSHKARLRGLPGEIGPQPERAAVATVSNICEATGRLGAADRRQRFAIARGEANEAGGMVEIAHLFGVLSDAQHE